MKMWDLYLPLKSLSAGKSRFTDLTASKRQNLVKAMALDVIAEILKVHAVKEIILVGVTREELGIPEDDRISSFKSGIYSGINKDVQAAELRKSNPFRAVILPDIPAVTAREIEVALSVAEDCEQSFIPDWTGTGSTFYASTKENAFAPQFGIESARAHSTANAFRIDSPIFRGIRHDCDQISDLRSIGFATLGIHTRKEMEQMVRE